MSALFCCEAVKPYRPQYLLHQDKFSSFIAWGEFPRTSSVGTQEEDKPSLAETNPPFAVQFVRQVNYGPLEAKRYFVPVEGKENEFIEIIEDDLIQANFQKLNSYKNYKCDDHDKFFEVNIYQKDPINKHHWRANLARPASSIDL